MGAWQSIVTEHKRSKLVRGRLVAKLKKPHTQKYFYIWTLAPKAQATKGIKVKMNHKKLKAFSIAEGKIKK